MALVHRVPAYDGLWLLELEGLMFFIEVIPKEWIRQQKFTANLGVEAMHAYALLDKVSAAFGSHQWALANVADDANKDNFSTIWNNQRGECLLNHYDDAVYLYGGRKKIYDLLSHYKFAKIKHAVNSHPDDRIYVFRAEFEVDGLPGFEKEKQILMFAVADSNRLAQLANLRDTDLDVDSFDKCYTGNDIRAKMRQKWPDRLR